MMKWTHCQREYFPFVLSPDKHKSPVTGNVHMNTLQRPTSHRVGIHKKRRALALLQFLPGRWTADVPLLHITHKHVLWLSNTRAKQRSELRSKHLLLLTIYCTCVHSRTVSLGLELFTCILSF